MRSQEDALRSLKRYVSLGLGSEWEVRLAREDGTFQRPFARVRSAGPTLMQGSPLVPEVVQPFTVHAYPAETDTGEETTQAVSVVEEAFATMFIRGIDLGRPWRVPLYDYTAQLPDGTDAGYPSLSLDEAADETRRGPRDFMRVNDVSVVPTVDPDDEILAVVTCDIRMSWTRFGQVLSPSPIVTRTPVAGIGGIG